MRKLEATVVVIMQIMCVIGQEEWAPPKNLGCYPPVFDTERRSGAALEGGRVARKVLLDAK
jgi:hypothetical protein